MIRQTQGDPYAAFISQKGRVQHQQKGKWRKSREKPGPWGETQGPVTIQVEVRREQSEMGYTD